MSREAKLFTIAPSDVIFLLAECQNCFYEKGRLGIKRPSTPFPGMFSKFADIESKYLLGRSTRELSEDLPEGQVHARERWVRSAELSLPGHDAKLVIRGRIDLGLKFNDGTFGLTDIKTAKRDRSLAEKYFMQLSLYSIAVEKPARDQVAMSPISEMGLFVLEPDVMYAAGDGYAVGFQGTYMPIERDDVRVYAQLDEVLSLLESPVPPEPSDSCGFCTWRQ